MTGSPDLRRMPATSAATAVAPGNLPRRAFVVISQAEAALTRILFVWLAIARRAFCDGFRPSRKGAPN